MAVARIKLLRNKRQVVVTQMRRDIAVLLQSGQDATARIRVFHFSTSLFRVFHAIYNSMKICFVIILG